MSTDFKDHFSDASDAYRVFRPGYPDELFTYLSSLTLDHELAWDCATGSGQTAMALSHHYSSVIGTDASQNQVEQAGQQEGVIYRVEKAEQSSFDDHSVDLVTVAQALHWFDIQAFITELKRVLKNGGVLAVWTYGLLEVKSSINHVINSSISSAINDEINTLYGPVLEDYWPAERRMVEEAYQGIAFPFEEISTPAFHMETEWSLSQLLGYLGTWSAVKRYIADRGDDPVQQSATKLARLWGDPETRLPMQWPLTVRAWRNC
ncbi:class I SAM-dependent methyltransferase [Kaarinaea lacus]